MRDAVLRWPYCEMEAIDQDAVASTLRKGMRLVQEMTELATAAAELLP